MQTAASVLQVLRTLEQAGSSTLVLVIAAFIEVSVPFKDVPAVCGPRKREPNYLINAIGDWEPRYKSPLYAVTSFMLQESFAYVRRRPWG